MRLYRALVTLHGLLSQKKKLLDLWPQHRGDLSPLRPVEFLAALFGHVKEAALPYQAI